MIERIREARREESGFTLIELLIVIVILGVLAGIVVFAVSAFNNDGKDSACKSDVKNVEIAQEAYNAKHNGNYAGSIDALINANYLKDAPDSSEKISTDNSGTVYHACTWTGQGPVPAP